MNEIGKVAAKGGRARDRRKQNGSTWVDRFAGTLDEDFARGALDLPAPSRHPDTRLG